jgi:hypothetical protein
MIVFYLLTHLYAKKIGANCCAAWLLREKLFLALRDSLFLLAKSRVVYSSQLERLFGS